ncbi:hypothetical protein O181_082837 [Austropuccinia psidii MF-1]|uniref:Integrase catalytic domain-containing protein n=1 Tax=Austropuccinia psidii MF-1 TaxID=1389203 RepID=A0A9Q3FTB9_9BASI|nr:hypothetical protein [Austropuccinia psidii MF-1]
MHQGTPELRSQPHPTSHSQRERVSQVKFVKQDASNRVLIDTGASIHLSGSHHFATTIIVYPLKSGSEVPEAVLDAIKQLQVCLGKTPKALQTNNVRELTLVSFTNALTKLGITFCPSLPYLPQENGKAERLNQTLGDMARAMMVKSGIPEQFWQFAYPSEAFLHNRRPKSRCLNSSPHQEFFGTAPSIATLYPFRADCIVHVPAVNQLHKLAPKGIECKLLKHLMLGGWLLWELSAKKMVLLASVIFPRFQSSTNSPRPTPKKLLGHIVNTMSLGEVLTERLFAAGNQAIDSLILVKDVCIPEHMGRVLSGPHCEKWRQACIAKLYQMTARDVWEVVEKKPGMKPIGHWWVFDLKRNVDGSVERSKARLVARGDRQQPGVDCTKTYAPTASLMSLRLVLATAILKSLWVASFNVSGAYLYSPVDETVLIEPPVDFLPELQGKALFLKKALYGMQQADNAVVISNFPDNMSNLKNELCAELNIKWLDKVQQIVGLECAIGEGEVAIAQQHLTISILDAYPRPVLRQDSPLPTLPVGSLVPDEAILDQNSFSICDWVSGLIRPLPIHPRPGTLYLSLWSNAGWGGDLKRSQMGFMIKLGNTPILWGSKRQSVVALSTCAAMYIALYELTQHLVKAINQLSQLTGDFNKTIFCNNQAAVQVSIDNKSQKHMRYLDCAFFFVNDTIQKHDIKVIWVKTTDMQAGSLTKRLFFRLFPF